MLFNAERVRTHYGERDEDARATLSQAAGLEFHYTKRLLSLYVKNTDHVAEIGCATGYYGLFLADKCASYTGIDLFPGHITQFEEKIRTAGVENLWAQVGDATDLADIADACFDTVLLLGPMYHLDEQRRAQAFSEAHRILKPGGKALFAYISSMGAYAKACLMWPHAYPNTQAGQAVLDEGHDDARPDLFFFVSPEAIEEAARNADFSVVRNAGVDFTFDDNMVNALEGERFEAWLALCDAMFESRSCAGLANHSVLVCEK